MLVKAGVLFRFTDSKYLIINLTDLRTKTMMHMWVSLQPVLS